MFMLRAFFTLICVCLAGSSAWAGLRADKTDVNASTGKAIVSVVFPTEIKGDLYLAFNLGGQLYFYDDLGAISTKLAPHIRNSTFNQTLQVLTVSSEGVPSGVYPLYQVVTIPNGDPLNFSNWIGGLGGLSTLNFRINMIEKPLEYSTTAVNTSTPPNLTLSPTSDCIAVKIQSRITKRIITEDKEGDSGGPDGTDSNDCKTGTDTTVKSDPSTTVDPSGNTNLTAQYIYLGKELYQKICASCHGSNAKADQNSVMRGRDPLKTRGAINTDKGGLMGILTDVSDKDLQMIAEYLKSIN